VPTAIRVIARFGLIVTCRLRRGDVEAVRAHVASMKRPQIYTPTLEVDDDEEWNGEASVDVVLRPGEGVDVRSGSAPLEVRRWPAARASALLARLGQ